MIIPLPLVVSLLLAISYAIEYDFKIELERCSKDTACYIRKSCLEKKKADAPSKVVLDDFTKADLNLLTGKTCDLIIQIKMFTEKRYLVLFKIGGPQTTDLKFSEGIKLVQGTQELSCKDSDNVEAKEPEFLKPESKKLKEPQFDATMMTCMFLLTAEGNTVKGLFENNDNPPTVVYHTDSENEVKVVYGGKKAVFWNMPTMRIDCVTANVGSIDDAVLTNEYEFAEVDTSTVELKCADKMMVSFGGSQYKVDKVVCDDQQWSWEGLSDPLSQSESFKAGCIGTKYCTTCGDLLTTVADCKPGECTAPEKTEEEECPVFKCADNKFTLDGKVNLISEKGVTCGKSGDGFKWLVHDTDGPGTEIESAVACRSFKACRRDDIKTACPADTVCLPAGPNINMETFNVTCAPGYALMNKGHPASGFSCNTKAGTWTPPGITEGNTYCEKIKEVKTAEQVSTGSGGTIAAVVVVVIVVLGLVGGLSYYFLVYKKKQAGQSKTKQPASSSKATSKKGAPSDGSKSAESKNTPKDKKESGSDQGKDTNKEAEKPKDPATPADPTKPAGEATPITPGPTNTPIADANKVAAPGPTNTPIADANKVAAGPAKSDPPAADPGQTAV